MPRLPRRSWSTRLARRLRRGMTEPEILLWNCLHYDFQWKFRRQEPIDRFIVDFVCYPKRLIVEVDGIQHADNPLDQERDAALSELGFRVLRFWNGDVMTELDSVLDTIEAALQSQPNCHRRRPPPSPPTAPPPPPEGEEQREHILPPHGEEQEEEIVLPPQGGVPNERSE